jgi:hypothetical protein
MPAKKLQHEVWMTDEYIMNYGELVLPGIVAKGKLEIFVYFDQFEFMETPNDPPDEDSDPWGYDSTPDAICATSQNHDYRLDIPVTAPAAKELLKAGLVSGVPEYIELWLKEDE